MNNILWKSSCHDYEEGYTLTIYELNNQYILRIECHRVEVGDFYSEDVITSDEALKIMLEELEYEDTEYLDGDFIYHASI